MCNTRTLWHINNPIETNEQITENIVYIFLNSLRKKPKAEQSLHEFI